MYILQAGEPATRRLASRAAPLPPVLDKWRIDELYDVTVVAAVDALADTSAAFDQSDRRRDLAKLPALLVSLFGSILRAFQTGVVHVYAAFMVVGLAASAGSSSCRTPPPRSRAIGGTRATTSSWPAPAWATRTAGTPTATGSPTAKSTSDQSSVKVHLDEGQSQNVLIEATSAFGIRSADRRPLSRPAAVKPTQLGQN